MGKLNLKMSKTAFEKGKTEFKEKGAFGDVQLDPGRYNAILQKVEPIGDGSNVAFRYHVPEARDGQGGEVSAIFSLDENRLVWLFRTIDSLGYSAADLSSPEELQAVFDDIAAKQPEVRIRVRHNAEGYQNISVDRVLAESTVGGEAPAEEVVEEEKPAPKAPAKTAAAAKPAPAKTAAKQQKIEEVVEEEVVEEEAVEEAPAAAEEEVEIKKGMKVKATIGGKEEACVIEDILESEKKVVVKVAASGKKFKVGLDKLSL